MRTILAALALLFAQGCVVVERPAPRPEAMVERETPPPQDDEVVYEDPPDPEPAEAVYEDPPDAPPPPIAVRYLPPPMRYEPPPPMPEPDMFWVGGYWVWGDGEWVWMSGHWMLPPRLEWVWVEPYYEVRGPYVVFVAGHWGPPGYVFRPPPPGIQITVVEARPAYRAPLVVREHVQGGVFVPAPPGSRVGIVVPAPLGTPPQVVVGAPPVVRPGMVVRGPNRPGNTTVINNTTVVNNVTIYAPAGVTRNGRQLETRVPSHPGRAAAMTPRSPVAPPSPPASVVSAKPGAFSPVVVNRPVVGERQRLPPTVTSHPTLQTLETHQPGPAGGGGATVRNEPSRSVAPPNTANTPPPPANTLRPPGLAGRNLPAGNPTGNQAPGNTGASPNTATPGGKAPGGADGGPPAARALTREPPGTSSPPPPPGTAKPPSTLQPNPHAGGLPVAGHEDKTLRTNRNLRPSAKEQNGKRGDDKGDKGEKDDKKDEKHR